MRTGPRPHIQKSFAAQSGRRVYKIKLRQSKLKQLGGRAIICKNTGHFSFTVDIFNIFCRPREMAARQQAPWMAMKRVVKLEQGIAGGKANLTWKATEGFDMADYIVVRILCECGNLREWHKSDILTLFGAGSIHQSRRSNPMWCTISIVMMFDRRLIRFPCRSAGICLQRVPTPSALHRSNRARTLK